MSQNQNGQSKKRGYDQFNQGQKRDANMLFGGNGQDDEDQMHGTTHYNQDVTGEDDFEAAEVNEINDDEDQDHSDEGEGDDLEDHVDADYQAVAELDHYEAAGLDENSQQELNHAQRRAAERQMELNQRRQQYTMQRQPDAFMDDEYSESNANSLMHDRANMHQLGGRGEENEDNLNQVNDYFDNKEPLASWINKDVVMSQIRRVFSQFLRTYIDETRQHVYEARIQEMCQNNKQSIEVNFTHLSDKQPTLAIWLAEEPTHMLPILHQTAAEIVAEVYPDYRSIHPEIFVRVRDLPVEDKLRDLRQVHLNALVKFRGVVTKRSGVYPQCSSMYFRCACGDLKGPTQGHSVYEAKQMLGTCIRCQRQGPYTLDEIETLYKNHQKLIIQETPGTVPPGRVPRQKECIVFHDQVDAARPGDEVEITGIYKNRYDYVANQKHGFPVFQTVVEINNLRRFGDEEIIELTDEDKAQIRNLSKKPDIAKRVFKSIAPSIYGHEFQKKGIAMCMFGGQAKDVGGKHRIRGDINMLLLGDPGTAKSQFLKYIEGVFHRVVYTTGKGASAVGLTAGVHKDTVTGEWTLEGGALVLADRGICLIDEFDKMNDQDRTSIHEAMEQQSISISKAGIVTSLHARCSVIAAANPIGGVYQKDRNFNDNVDLTDPILSRFDLLTVIRDEAKEDVDDSLATFVLNSHMRSHPRAKRALRNDNQEGMQAMNAQLYQQDKDFVLSNLLDESNMLKNDTTDLIDQETLKKYIMYAKRFVHPKLSEIDNEKVTQFYADIRKQSSVVGGIPIAVRHIESVLRMSEAYASLHLRDYVRSDDIDFAIQMLLESFLSSQKMSVQRVLMKKFDKYLHRPTETIQSLILILDKLARQKALIHKMNQGIEEEERVQIQIKISDFQKEASEYKINIVEDFLKSDAFLKRYQVTDGVIKGTLFL